MFKKLLSIDTCNNVGESEKYVEQKRQIQKSTHWMIPGLWSSRTDKTHPLWKKSKQWLNIGGMETDKNEKHSLLGDGSILYLD